MERWNTGALFFCVFIMFFVFLVHTIDDSMEPKKEIMEEIK
jgi:hypothetical protein